MINEQIRDKEVRLIGADGEQLGIVSAKEAQKLAEEAEGHGRLGSSTGLGDDIDGEVIITDQLHHFTQLVGREAVAGKVDVGRILLFQVVVVLQGEQIFLVALFRRDDAVLVCILQVVLACLIL